MKKRVGEQRKYNKGLIFQNPHQDSSISNPRFTLSHSELNSKDIHSEIHRKKLAVFCNNYGF